MNEERLVSIIIPVYNVASCLRRCIESLTNQKYVHIEIIVIDDGSTDKSLDILNEIQKKDARLVIISQKNSGQAAARNRGIDIAQGEYIMFVDSDDYVSPEFVSKPLELMNSSDSDLIVFDVLFISDQNKEYRRSGTRLSDSSSMSVNKLYKKDLWNTIRFPIGYWYEDLGTIPIVVATALKVTKLNDATYYYTRDRQNSQSNTINFDKLLDTIPMCERVYCLVTEAQPNSKFMRNELKLLFIDHLVNNTMLLKFIDINKKEQRIKMIDAISDELQKYFPDWKLSDYSNGNRFTKYIKRIAVFFYMHKLFVLGDIIWKYPQKIKMKGKI